MTAALRRARGEWAMWPREEVMEAWRGRLGRAGQGLMQFLAVMTDAPGEVRAWPLRRRVEAAAPAEPTPADDTAPAELTPADDAAPAPAATETSPTGAAAVAPPAS